MAIQNRSAAELISNFKYKRSNEQIYSEKCWHPPLFDLRQHFLDKDGPLPEKKFIGNNYRLGKSTTFAKKKNKP